MFSIQLFNIDGQRLIVTYYVKWLFYLNPLKFLTTIKTTTPNIMPTNESNQPTGLTLETKNINVDTPKIIPIIVEMLNLIFFSLYKNCAS